MSKHKKEHDRATRRDGHFTKQVSKDHQEPDYGMQTSAQTVALVGYQTAGLESHKEVSKMTHDSTVEIAKHTIDKAPEIAKKLAPQRMTVTGVMEGVSEQFTDIGEGISDEGSGAKIQQTVNVYGVATYVNAVTEEKPKASISKVHEKNASSEFGTVNATKSHFTKEKVQSELHIARSALGQELSPSISALIRLTQQSRAESLTAQPPLFSAGTVLKESTVTKREIGSVVKLGHETSASVEEWDQKKSALKALDETLKDTLQGHVKSKISQEKHGKLSSTKSDYTKTTFSSDHGYLALDTTREFMHALLAGHSQDSVVRSFLMTEVEALKDDNAFANYASQHPFKMELVRVYIDRMVRDKKHNSGWPTHAVIQSFAYLKQRNVLLWKRNSSNEMISKGSDQYLYDKFNHLPRIDLIFLDKVCFHRQYAIKLPSSLLNASTLIGDQVAVTIKDNVLSLQDKALNKQIDPGVRDTLSAFFNNPARKVLPPIFKAGTEIKACQVRFLRVGHSTQIGEHLEKNPQKQGESTQYLFVDLHLNITLLEGSMVKLIKNLRLKGPYWRLPDRYRYFIARDESLLKKLQLHFEAKSSKSTDNEKNTQTILCLVGTKKGVGKKVAALEYSHQALERAAFGLVVWINIKNGLKATYQALAHDLGLTFDDKTSMRSLISKIYMKLDALYVSQVGQRILFVFENALHLVSKHPGESLDAYLPPSQYQNSMRVLITSRNEQLWTKQRFISLNVKRFTVDESVRYVLRKMNDAADDDGIIPDEAEAKRLVKAVGYLPLHLTRAIDYMCCHQLNVEDYLARLEEERDEMLNEKVYKDDPHESSDDELGLTR